METIYSAGKEGPTEGVHITVLSSCVVANGGLIGPLQLITLVGKHRVRLGAIGNQDTLEGVYLKRGDSAIIITELHS